MKVECDESSVIGEEHVIKLNDRNIKLQMHYHSPPKTLPYPQLPSRKLLRDPSSPLPKNRRSQTKYIVEVGKNKYSKLFYKDHIDETSKLLKQYENFHLDILKGQNHSQRRINVYSRHKEKIDQPWAINPIPVKQIDISINANTSHKPHPPIRKIRLQSPSPLKNKQNQQENSPNVINIKLFDNKANISTPKRKRPIKIQVTSSSKSRKKDYSQISHHSQLSRSMAQFLRSPNSFPAVTSLNLSRN